MSSHPRTGRFLSLALLCASLTTAAQASAAEIKGQVVGTPYVASATRTAIPVLISKETARRAKLQSQIGVVIAARKKAVSAPGGSVLPGRLRLGDRFKAVTRVGSDARRALYPRLTLTSLAVTRRSKQLSVDELEELINITRRDLARLTDSVTGLARYTQNSLNALTGRVDGLRADVDALTADLAALKNQVGALALSLDSASNLLRARIDQVRADLQPQVDALADALDALSALLGSCATPTSIVGRICGLETLLGGLDASAVTNLISRVDDLSSALTGVVSHLTGLSLVGDLPAALTSQITTALGELAGLQSTVAGLGGTVADMGATLGGLEDTVDTLTGQLGGVDVGALSTTVGNLLGTLGTDPTGLNSDVLADLTGDVGTLQTQVTGILGNIGAVDIEDLALDVSSLQGQLATVTGTVNGLCSTINGQSIPVLGTLPLIGSVTGLLTATLPDACP